MKPSDELSELIQSMSPSEKRYFKLQAGTFKDDSHYLLLFDVLDKNLVAGDSSLLDYLKSKGVTVSLSRLKNYLHQLIMKTLRDYHLEHYPEFKIIEAFRDYRILKDRKLDRQGTKALNKAVKLAKDYERFSYLWEITRHLAGENILESDSVRYQKNTEALLADQDEALRKLKLIGECHRLETQAIIIEKEHIKTSDPAKLKAIDMLLERANMLDGPSLPNYGRAHVQNVYNICYSQTNRYSEALEHNTAYIRLLKEKPVACGSTDEQVLFTYTNQLYHLIYQGKIEDFKMLTAEIRANASSFFMGQGEYYQNALLFSSYSFEISLAILTGNFEEGEQYVEPAQKILVRHPDIANAEFLFAWLYRMVVLYFGLGQYSKAQQAINTILDGKVLRYGADFANYIKMLNVIVLFELGHHKMLPSSMKATEQFVRGRGNLNVIDKLLIEMLKKLIKCKGEGEVKVLCSDVAEKIKAEIEADPSARTPLQYFDFLTWMEGKTNGLLFGQAMKQKALES